MLLVPKLSSATANKVAVSSPVYVSPGDLQLENEITLLAEKHRDRHQVEIFCSMRAQQTNMDAKLTLLSLVSYLSNL